MSDRSAQRLCVVPPESHPLLAARLATQDAHAAIIAGGDPKVLIVDGRSILSQDPVFGNALNRLPYFVDHRR